MGRRGPKPTPTEKLNQRGSWRGKVREGEPQPETGAPECPAWVGETARAHWPEVAKALEGMGVLTVADGIALGLLVESMALYIDASKDVREHGTWTSTQGGNVVQHPAVGVRNKAWEQVLKVCREFGLTPSARTGIKTEAAQKQESDGKGRFFKPKLAG